MSVLEFNITGDGYKRKWPVPAESQESPWEDCTVNIKKGEIRRKQMASFQNFVNCSHKPSLFYKVAQVLGITLKQLFSEFKGFRVYVMLPKTRSLHLYHKLTSFQNLLEKKKKLNKSFKKVMKNSHAASKHKNTKHTHKKSQKQFHIVLGLRRSLSEIKILHHRKDNITTY